MKKPILILGDLIFPEGSIWNNGLLYFSDIFSHEVVSLSLEGKRETVFSLQDDYPVGVGLLPNGKMLINSLFGKKVLLGDPENVNFTKRICNECFRGTKIHFLNCWKLI